MAIMNKGETVNYFANGDLSSAKYTFVYQDAATTVAPCVDSTKVGLYVLQNAPASGIVAEVVGDDETLVKVGAALSVGAAVMCSTGSLAVAATSGNKTVGILREASTASGDIVRMQFVGPFTTT